MREKLQKEAKTLQVYRSAGSVIYQNFLRLPEFDFCRAKITRNRGAFLFLANLQQKTGVLRLSFYFLLQVEEIFRIEKINYGYLQPVADFLYGGDGGVVTLSVYNVAKCRLCYAADGGEFIYSDVALSA